MNKTSKNETGFSTVETILVLVIIVLIGVVGYLVYHNDHMTTIANAAKTSTVSSQSKANSNTSNSSNKQPAQQYLTISEWGVRVPYPSGDTLSASGQTCYENGDAVGDTVNLGCQVTVTSKDLANSVGGCTANVGGTVGYFYRMGANDNYSATNGSGFTPIAQWASQNPGQYTQVGNYYYAFAEIGKATGLSGAEVADSNEMNGTYTGCSTWQAKYGTVEQSVQALASKFVTM